MNYYIILHNTLIVNKISYGYTTQFFSGVGPIAPPLYPQLVETFSK